MKKINQLLLLAALLVSPVMVTAQWNHVRFDQANIFRKLFAATGNNAFVLGTGPTTGEYFMVRTNDGGQTWDSIWLNTASATYELYELYFRDPVNGFTGGIKNNTNQVLLKTIDNATTWTEITPDPSSTESITAIYFLTPSTGFVTSNSMLYFTSNGGTSWTSQAMPFIANDIFFSDMSNGYACGTTTTNGTAVMMKTTDGGQTWTPLLSMSNPNFFVNAFLKEDILPNGVAFTSMQHTNALFKTLDGGATWDTIVVDSVYAIQDFQFTSALIGHVLSDQGQIYVTLDGGLTWSLEYATAWGFYGPSIYFFSMSFVEEIGYVCGTSGLIKKHDATANSIDEHNGASGLSLYPNPLNHTQELNIETAGDASDVKVEIVNAVGQVVFSKQISNAPDKITITGLNLPAGIYSVNVETKEMRNTKKLMIVE